MPPFKPFYRPPKGHQPEQGRDHDDGIHAGALPVAAAQMQPHPEFIKRQTHRDAVEQGGELGLASGGSAENAITAHGREQEDAVVEVMHMGAVQEKIKIRQGIRHDEKDADAREQEGDEKAEQGSARQPVRRFARYVGFGSHKFAVGLSGFGERVEKFRGAAGVKSGINQMPAPPAVFHGGETLACQMGTALATVLLVRNDSIASTQKISFCYP